jgi:WD40 repeat protein
MDIPFSHRRLLKGHEGAIFGMDYAFQTNTLASVSDDRTLRLWDLNDPSDDSLSKHHFICYGHLARIWCVKFASADTLAVTASEDCCCRIWSVDDGSCIGHYESGTSKNIWSIAVDTPSGIFAAGAGDSGITLWNLKESKRKQFTFIAQTDSIRSFSSNLQNEVLFAMDSGVIYSFNVPSLSSS